ncbi:MAG TPA: ABC transporter permease subunit [Rhodothermales bacterium]
MSLSRIFIIFRKELRDTLRDRRTLIMMIIIPMVLVPALMIGATTIATSQQQEAQERTLRLALIDNGNAVGFRALIESRSDLQVVPGVVPDSARSLVRNDSLDAVFIVDPAFDSTVAALRPGQITFVYESDGDMAVSGRLQSIVDEYRRALLAKRLEQGGLPQTFTQTVDLQHVDVATTQEVIGRLIGGFLPYIFLIFCYLGAMYPAIDLAAGEKERATLETLLTSPASRMEILLGKFCVVVLAGIASATIGLLGMIVGLRQAPEMPAELLQTVQNILTVKSILLELSLLLPLTMFFAAMLLTLSVFARSFKEAQSIVSPMSFVVIVPAAIGMLPVLELTPLTAVIPILNVSLATKEIVAGTIDVGLLALVYLSLVLLAAIALVICAKQFQREQVLFRS